MLFWAADFVKKTYLLRGVRPALPPESVRPWPTPKLMPTRPTFGGGSGTGTPPPAVPSRSQGAQGLRHAAPQGCHLPRLHDQKDSA